MSMSDPIADLLTRLRNAQAASKLEVSMPASKLKLAVAEVLKQEGYIEDYRHGTAAGLPILTVAIKYYQGRPVIQQLKRISRPGLRVFRGKEDLPRVMGGLGVAIVSTSAGVMSDRRARAAGHGGEVLCTVA